MAQWSYLRRPHAVPNWHMPTTARAPQFTNAELKFIFDALLDVRVVLQAVEGGILQHPGEPPVRLHDLGPELARVEAALMLVAAA